MQITFNPLDPTEVQHIAALLSGIASTGAHPASVTTQTGNITSSPEDRQDPNAVERDSNGVPYLADWHSPNKTKNADGSWRRKKGVDKAQAEAAEMAARGAAPAMTSAQATAPTVPGAPGLPPSPPAGAPGLPPPPSPPAAPVVQPVSYEEVIATLQRYRNHPSTNPGMPTADVWQEWLDACDLESNEELQADTPDAAAGRIALKALIETFL